MKLDDVCQFALEYLALSCFAWISELLEMSALEQFYSSKIADSWQKWIHCSKRVVLVYLWPIQSYFRSFGYLWLFTAYCISGVYFQKALFVPNTSVYYKVGTSSVPPDDTQVNLSWQLSLQRIWENLICDLKGIGLTCYRCTTWLPMFCIWRVSNREWLPNWLILDFLSWRT